MKKYRVWWVNLFYYAQEEFEDVEQALEYIKSKGFAGTVHDKDGKILAAYDRFAGTRYYTVSDAAEEMVEPLVTQSTFVDDVFPESERAQRLSTNDIAKAIVRAAPKMSIEQLLALGWYAWAVIRIG